MGYLDTTDAEIRDLTRQRRAEAVAWRAANRLEPPERIQLTAGWKLAQWEAGIRACFYCDCELIWEGWGPKNRILSVDHVRPRCDGGADHPLNFVLCCRLCNHMKANLSEWRFRDRMLPIILRRRAEMSDQIGQLDNAVAFRSECPRGSPLMADLLTPPPTYERERTGRPAPGDPPWTRRRKRSPRSNWPAGSCG